MRFALTILMFSACVANAAFGTFTWPSGVSNRGPYTLLSSVSNTTVISPSGATISEADISTHQYHHHTRIWWLTNGTASGTIALAYSSCATNEADGGMQTVVSFSTNLGVSWSSPVLAVPSQSRWIYTSGYFTNNVRVTYPRNFTSYGGTNYLITAVDQFVNDGREHGDALLACAVYSDQTIGPLFRISSATYTNMDGKTSVDYNSTLGPPLMVDTKLYGCWGGTSPGGEPASEWIGWLWDGTGTVVEPNVFPADASSTNFYRIWRAVGTYDTHLVYQQTSTNAGTNWSAISATEIPNAPSETVGRRLADGRTVFLGNPTYYSGAGRDPLFLAITDGTATITNVWAVRQGDSQIPTYGGWGKGGGASYVDCIQVRSNLLISYSLQKETISFSKVPIPGYVADSEPTTIAIKNLWIVQ